jgi:hypothetical protein
VVELNPNGRKNRWSLQKVWRRRRRDHSDQIIAACLFALVDPFFSEVHASPAGSVSPYT